MGVEGEIAMSREVRNCRRCGKIFVYVGVPVCRDCLAKEEEQYNVVKRYVDGHPGSGVQETSDETGVPVDVVVEFLRRGLLVTQSGPAGQLVCVVCKKPITKGKLCPKCEEALAVCQVPSVENTHVRSRMYTMDSIGRKSD